ncbi:hypothetical protein FRC11_001240 [Ceratobasidium sp. 423]|nr:hypothetical protein FRC11_001240 [Ceratobasidium sp. 423]
MPVSLDSPEFSNTFPSLAPRVNLGPETTYPVYVVYRGNYRGAWADYKSSVELIRMRLPTALSHCQTFCFAWSLTEVYYTLTYEQSFGEIVRLYSNRELHKVLLHHFGAWQHVIIGWTLREKISSQPNPLPLAPNEMATIPTQAGPALPVATSPLLNPIASQEPLSLSQQTPPSSQQLPAVLQRVQQFSQLPLSSQPAISLPMGPLTNPSSISFLGSPLHSALSPTPTSSSTSATGSPNKRPLAALFTRTQSLVSWTRSSAGSGRWGASIPSLGGTETAQIIEYAISTHVAKAMAVVHNAGGRFGAQYEMETIDALMAQLAHCRSELERPELEGTVEEVKETIYGDEDTQDLELGRAGPGPLT